MRAMRQVVASAVVMALAAWPLLGTLPGCAEEKKPVPPMAHVAMPDLSDVGLRQTWQRQLKLEPGEVIKHAWRVGPSIYVASDQSRLFRIAANSGVQVWGVGLGDENFDIYQPIELKPAQGPALEVLVVTRGQAFVLDKTSGYVTRSASLGISVSTKPVLVGDIMCVGGAGRFQGMFLDNLGTRAWNIRPEGDLFDSAPVIVDKTIIVASETGQLWRINPATGIWEWKDRKTNGNVVGGLVADGRAVYVPCMDQRLYAFSVEGGGELWQSQLEGTLDQTPALGNGIIMVPSRGHGLFAVDRKHGEHKWNAPGVTAVATVEDNSVWVGDEEGNLKSLSLETGEVLASARIPEAQLFVRNIDDEDVILVNRTGTVGSYHAK